MTERIEQWICIRFCIKLEHSSVETTWMIQNATAMGNWWLAASSQQHAHPCIMSCAEFFGKTSNHPGDSAPQQPRFGTRWLLAFPKTKITFEREEISDCQWDSGKYNGTADGDWENCVRSQGAYFERDSGIFVLCTMFIVSCIFNNCIYFSYNMAGYFLDRPCILSAWKTKVTHLSASDFSSVQEEPPRWPQMIPPPASHTFLQSPPTL